MKLVNATERDSGTRLEQNMGERVEVMNGGKLDKREESGIREVVTRQGGEA